MAQIPQYKIVYTESAIQDIEEKADYIAAQFRDPDLAEEWYFRLKFEIQKQLTTFPFKYQPYHLEPWAGRGVRQYVTRNDVVLYSVDEDGRQVFIRAICTRGQDLAAHLAEQK